jgi:hypothetical protein
VIDREADPVRESLEKAHIAKLVGNMDRQDLSFGRDSHEAASTASLGGDQCSHSGTVPVLFDVEILTSVALLASRVATF